MKIILMVVMVFTIASLTPSIAFAFHIVDTGSYVEGNTLHIVQPQWIKGDDGAWHNFTDYVGMYQDGTNIVIEYGKKTVIVTPYIETTTIEKARIGDAKANDMVFAYTTSKIDNAKEFALNVNDVVDKESKVSFDVWSDKTEVVNDGLKYYFDGMTLDFSDIKDSGFITESKDGMVSVNLKTGDNNLDPTLNITASGIYCGDYSYSDIIVNGTSVITTNCTYINFIATGSFNMTSGAKINLTGLGNCTGGPGIGGGTGGAGSGGGGGAYGNNGTNAAGAAGYGLGGIRYGTDIYDDIAVGSAGGNGQGVGATQGCGGGMIIISAPVINMNGLITVSGNESQSSATASGGSGSGGGIFLNATVSLNLSGATLNANGGNASTGGTNPGGVGSGGRIKIRYGKSFDNTSLTVNVLGGTGNGVAAGLNNGTYAILPTLNIFLRSEIDLSVLSAVNVTISNSTYSVSYNNVSDNILIPFNIMPHGNIEIHGMYKSNQRYLYTTFNYPDSSKNMTMYFPESSSPFQFIAYYISPANAIVNVTISVFKNYNNSILLLGQKKTQIDGTADIFLVPDQPSNTVLASSALYGDLQFDYYFSSYKLATGQQIPIDYAKLNSTLLYPPINAWILSFITVKFDPQNKTSSNTSYYVNVSVNDSTSTATWIALNVTRFSFDANYTHFYYKNTTGYVANFTTYLQYNGTYFFRILIFYNDTLYEVDKYYRQTSGSGNMFNFAQWDQSGGFSLTFVQIIFYMLIVFAGLILIPILGANVLWVFIILFTLGGFTGIYNINPVVNGSVTLGLVLLCAISLLGLSKK